MRAWERSLGLVQKLAGVDEAMGPDIALRRTLLLAASIIYSVTGVLWGAAYVALGEALAGLIPIGYGVLTAVNVVVFVRLGSERWFRQSQLGLTLLLPFLLQLALGGVVPSGAVIVFAFTSPLGALLLGEEGTADRWFVAFVVLLVASVLIQPLVGEGNSMTATTQRAFLVANVGTTMSVVFVLLRYFNSLKSRAYAQLRVEEDKSERLLLNVLPAEIVEVLREGEDAPATAHDDVTVLFADMVGFTHLTEQLSPVEMVDLLNEIFSYFDELVLRHQVEKVRTMGDAYMIVAGVPRARADHAETMATLALEMLDFADHVAHPSAASVAFRVGINSGPVVAGVIGTTKFHYDVWGDAVNVAARMESHGVPGRVHVGPGGYPLLAATFGLEPRGMTKIKGKGELETWLLVGPREE